MAVLQNFNLVEDANAPMVGAAIGTNFQTNQLVLQAIGSATSFTFTIEGRTSPNADFAPLTAIDTNGFSLQNEISSKGIFAIGASGVQAIRANVASVSGGELTILCQATD